MDSDRFKLLSMDSLMLICAMAKRTRHPPNPAAFQGKGRQSARVGGLIDGKRNYNPSIYFVNMFMVARFRRSVNGFFINFYGSEILYGI
ncbi:MAG: hypothetical protein LUD69_03215 [Oscillospiraceae bacterium]|nr:hypothetical protein [Oscillospiraceae bacterium]